MGALLAAYRRTGADPPFGDPARVHGTAFEGWFWRFTHAERGTVAIALVGVNRDRGGRPWGTLGLSAHPLPGRGRSALVGAAHATPGGHDLRVGTAASPACVAGRDRLRMHLADDARLDVHLEGIVAFPRRAFGGVGPAHAIPRLSQYWHPTVLGGRAAGSLRIEDVEVDLDGAEVYAEKNWGAGGFPDAWWWGQAHGFDPAARVGVAFAGGRAGLGPVHTRASAVVVRLGDDVLRFVRPPGRVTVAVEGAGWHLRAARRGWRVEIEGDANASVAHLLPIPDPAARRHLEQAAAQHLAGRLRLRVTRRGQVVFDGESLLAGLERGDATGAADLAPRAPAAAVE